jgi:hypothetical protein
MISDRDLFHEKGEYKTPHEAEKLEGMAILGSEITWLG